MIGLMVLHWGTIQQGITVSGIDPASGFIPPAIASGGLVARKGSGNTSVISGSGGTAGISGSGGGD